MKLSDLSENDYQVESNTSEEAPLSLSSLSETDYKVETPDEIEQPEEVALTPITEQITTPMAGYVAGKTVQRGIEKTGKAILEAPEKIAMKIGGLTPEQVDYYKQNYTDIEANKGISQEAIDEAYSKLESKFKLKNIEANRARKAAESALDVPVTQALLTIK